MIILCFVCELGVSIEARHGMLARQQRKYMQPQPFLDRKRLQKKKKKSYHGMAATTTLYQYLGSTLSMHIYDILSEHIAKSINY